jgi:redox-sensitive bicupin YhaK (pirin superfamily)
MAVQPSAASKGRLYRFTRTSIVIFQLTLLTIIISHAAAFSSLQPITRNPRNKQLYSSQWDDSFFSSPVQQVEPVSTNPSKSRSIARLEKFARLPVWPVWNGVFIFLVSKLFGQEMAAKLEDAIGGRVCPNFFQSEQTSPFIMLVHHRHSFAPWDPLRYVQRTFFPEGFPAHPHRGFVTVTYILKGGFTHRDSLGIKQVYGAEERHKGKHTQWLTTGAGILHEEMWDIAPDKGGINFLQPSSQELYQLWLNVPSDKKMIPPRVDVLGGEDETPTVINESNGGKSETLVLAGTFQGRTSKAPCLSNVSIFHVEMSQGSTWKYEIPASFRTAIIYVRTGSLSIGAMRVPPHYTAYLGVSGSILEISSKEGADFLLLAGEPLSEPVAAQGSMVMNSPEEINLAYSDYQSGRMGAPWSETLTDEEWMQHVAKFPSAYKVDESTQ